MPRTEVPQTEPEDLAELVISFDDAGRMRFVYDDRLAGLLDLGDGQVDRASHVEPDAAGGWQADMRPVDGPVLRDGPRGFRFRSEALAAERRWLRENLGL